MSRSCLFLSIATLIAIAVPVRTAEAVRPVVPGSGLKYEKIGDNFEEEDWTYYMNGHKSSEEQDGRVRRPGGLSKNRRWAESAKRGHPDMIKVVPTPEGGIEGSTQSLLMRTRATGIPGRWSGRLNQDDLLLQVRARIGSIPVSRSPSVVTRVYVPPFDKWLDYSAASFALRADVTGTKSSGWKTETEPYWPGMFIVFRSETDSKHEKDSAFIRVRANSRGFDVTGPEVTPGWWTLGMSFSPDGMIHYFASEGVDDLTRARSFPLQALAIGHLRAQVASLSRRRGIASSQFPRDFATI